MRRLALVLLAPLAAAPIRAQTPDLEPDTFTLVGQVLDVRGDVPLGDAAVTVVELDRTVLSNYVGRFAFPGLTAGTWTFRVRRFGYEGSQEASAVAPGVVLRVRLAARPFEVAPLVVSVASAESRLRDRRLKASGFSGFRVWGAEELRGAFQFSAVSFMRSRGVTLLGCPGEIRHTPGCTFVRGSPARVCVMVDDAPLAGGLEALDLWAPQEFHTIEYFRQLAQVRAYTHRYMRDLEERPRGLQPVAFEGCYGGLGT